MAYDTNELYKQAEQAIDEHDIYFVSDVYHFLGISSATFYDHFPNDSNKMKALKRKLAKNKQNTKVLLRGQWKDGTAALQISLYKLIAEKDELNRINNARQDNDMENYIKILTDALQPIPKAEESD